MSHLKRSNCDSWLAKFAFNCSITVLRVGPIFASPMINVIITMLMSSILYLFIITERNWRFEILLGSRPHSWHIQYANISDIWLSSVEQIDLKKGRILGFAILPVSQKNAFIIFILFSGSIDCHNGGRHQAQAHFNIFSYQNHKKMIKVSCYQKLDINLNNFLQVPIKIKYRFKMTLR